MDLESGIGVGFKVNNLRLQPVGIFRGAIISVCSVQSDLPVGLNVSLIISSTVPQLLRSHLERPVVDVLVRDVLDVRPFESGELRILLRLRKVVSRTAKRERGGSVLATSAHRRAWVQISQDRLTAPVRLV